MNDRAQTPLFFTKPVVELVSHSSTDEQVLRAMLVSTLGDHRILRDPPSSDSPNFREWQGEMSKAFGRIMFLMKNRHGSPFEHTHFTFRVEAPIAVFREWHRHRAGWSYNEMSGRYTEMRPHFYVPDYTRPMRQVGKPGAYTMEPHDDPESVIRVIETSCRIAWSAYEDLLERGVCNEVARGVLPVYTMSEMYATCNARSLLHFLSLRTDEPKSMFPSKPMHEIEQCARIMESYLAAMMPLTFNAWEACGRVAP